MSRHKLWLLGLVELFHMLWSAADSASSFKRDYKREARVKYSLQQDIPIKKLNSCNNTYL